MTENQIKSIVEEVMAKMQLSGSTSGMHGVFSDMDTAIAKAKEAQKIVRVMSMDQREKIISKMREKIRENAETMARMGVDETGMGNVGDKILKHLLVAEKTPGTEDITTTAWSGDRGLTLVEMGPFGVIGAITPCTNPSETVPLQYHGHAGRRQHGGVQPPSPGHQDVHLRHQSSERGVPWRPAGRTTLPARWRNRPWIPAA